MKKIKSFIKSKNGGILIYVLIVFFVLSILTAAVLSTFNSNLIQARKQEEYMETYYLAYSGAYMGFAAITADSDGDGNGNDILEDISDTDSNYSETDIVFGDGKIDIQASRSDNSLYPGWIKIVSSAKLDDGDTTVTRTLYVDSDNQKNVKWE